MDVRADHEIGIGIGIGLRPGFSRIRRFRARGCAPILDYPKAEFAAKLRRLADAIERGERFEIQIAGERIHVPVRVTFNLGVNSAQKPEKKVQTPRSM